MTKSGLFVCLLLLAIPIAAPADDEKGCTCERIPRVWREYKQAKAIFTGVLEADSDQLLRLRVTEAWKGVPIETREIELASRTPAECGYDFEPRVYYMVYAYEDERTETEDLWVSSCSRTRPSAEANRDREIIGRPKWIRW